MDKSELLTEIKKDKAFRNALRDTLKVDVYEKEYYNLDEFSVITGLSPLALKNRRKKGLIRMVNEGNEILISKSEVEKFVAHLSKHL
jgi:hypothetical protein